MGMRKQTEPAAEQTTETTGTSPAEAPVTEGTSEEQEQTEPAAEQTTEESDDPDSAGEPAIPSDEEIIYEIAAVTEIPQLYEIQQKYPDRSQEVEDAINAKGNELAGITAPAIELVKMVRQDGPPFEADVHPDEVDNYMAGGWELAE